MLITVKAHAHYLQKQCKNRFTQIIRGFTLSNALLAHLLLVDFFLESPTFPLHSRIRHQTNDFLFFILEFDLMILDLAEGALSASEAMNLGFTGRKSV